jgi:hypothetical protein
MHAHKRIQITSWPRLEGYLLSAKLQYLGKGPLAICEGLPGITGNMSDHFYYLGDSGVYVHEGCCLGDYCHPLTYVGGEGSGMVS